MEHQIIIETEVEGVEAFADALREVIPAALEAEGVGLPCEVDVLFTDDGGIHQINLEQRDVDRATDVLSFPMFEFTPGEPPTPEDGDLLDPGSGVLPLGDMVLSVDHIRAQAAEFGHSERRELCYPGGPLGAPSAGLRPPGRRPPEAADAGAGRGHSGRAGDHPRAGGDGQPLMQMLIPIKIAQES